MLGSRRYAGARSATHGGVGCVEVRRWRFPSQPLGGVTTAGPLGGATPLAPNGGKLGRREQRACTARAAPIDFFEREADSGGGSVHPPTEVRHPGRPLTVGTGPQILSRLPNPLRSLNSRRQFRRTVSLLAPCSRNIQLAPPRAPPRAISCSRLLAHPARASPARACSRRFSPLAECSRLPAHPARSPLAPTHPDHGSTNSPCKI
jgi:hypothetical protein